MNSSRRDELIFRFLFFNPEHHDIASPYVRREMYEFVGMVTDILNVDDWSRCPYEMTYGQFLFQAKLAREGIIKALSRYELSRIRVVVDNVTKAPEPVLRPQM